MQQAEMKEDIQTIADTTTEANRQIREEMTDHIGLLQKEWYESHDEEDFFNGAGAEVEGAAEIAEQTRKNQKTPGQ